MSASDNLGRQWKQPVLPGMGGPIKKHADLFNTTHRGYKLSYSQNIYHKNSSSPSISHSISATHRGKEVGKLEWEGDTPEITNIYVDEKHQRKGIATAMYNMARKLPTKEVLGHSSHRSDEGEAWSRKTEGYYPRAYNSNGSPISDEEVSESSKR